MGSPIQPSRNGGSTLITSQRHLLLRHKWSVSSGKWGLGREGQVLDLGQPWHVELDRRGVCGEACALYGGGVSLVGYRTFGVVCALLELGEYI